MSKKKTPLDCEERFSPQNTGLWLRHRTRLTPKNSQQMKAARKYLEVKRRNVEQNWPSWARQDAESLLQHSDEWVRNDANEVLGLLMNLPDPAPVEALLGLRIGMILQRAQIRAFGGEKAAGVGRKIIAGGKKGHSARSDVLSDAKVKRALAEFKTLVGQGYKHVEAEVKIATKYGVSPRTVRNWRRRKDRRLANRGKDLLVSNLPKP